MFTINAMLGAGLLIQNKLSSTEINSLIRKVKIGGKVIS